MSALSARVARSSMALRPTMPAVQRGFCASARLRNNEKEPVGPKSQHKPVSKGENVQIYLLGGVGLALGGAFFFLQSSPELAKETPIEGVKSKPFSPK
ncbi:hypothetical protein FSARC_12377 [Fusarium sarcochroum]|uniref:Uncharacterized protein n=1 Tax=Fusarium sarcochroum TaxID=1208366 RepID=A0A8H4T924_9HYPO|nr:hypothetical protein FSARC_12377 [Fusarium sarcochroum]